MAFVPDNGGSLLRNPVWLRLGAVLLIWARSFLFLAPRERATSSSIASYRQIIRPALPPLLSLTDR